VLATRSYDVLTVVLVTRRPSSLRLGFAIRRVLPSRVGVRCRVSPRARQGRRALHRPSRGQARDDPLIADGGRSCLVRPAQCGV